jgi:hypothetical protein
MSIKEQDRPMPGTYATDDVANAINPHIFKAGTPHLFGQTDGHRFFMRGQARYAHQLLQKCSHRFGMMRRKGDIQR